MNGQLIPSICNTTQIEKEIIPQQNQHTQPTTNVSKLLLSAL